jgi:hypothetical protein
MKGAPYEQPYSISTQDHSLTGTQADNFVGSDFEFVTVLSLVVQKDYFNTENVLILPILGKLR